MTSVPLPQQPTRLDSGTILSTVSVIMGPGLAIRMSGPGLGRVKTRFPGKSVEARTGLVSGHDRGRQRLGPDDVHDPCQIEGQDRESYPHRRL